jgi:predicted nucleic acid-binding protein
VIVVDTSVWVGTLLATDASFAESSAWYAFWFARGHEIHFPNLILAELAGVLSRRGTPISAVSDLVNELIVRPAIHLHVPEQPLALLAADIASNAGLKGADATFVALASALDLPLITWDKQQREHGKMFCRTMTPVEAMEIAE